MPETPAAIRETTLPGLISRGKVRDLYALGDRLMIVATDRISAFDVVMHEPVPDKGIVLTQISRFWLETLPACTPHHLDYVVDDAHVPAGYADSVKQLRGRAMVCKKARVLPVECVVRGYIVGGGWQEYRQTGHVSGIELPRGLQLAQRLPEPLFTPSTKATDGHDEPIAFERAGEIAQEFLRGSSPRPEPGPSGAMPPTTGQTLMEMIRARSIRLYLEAAAHAESHGIILADTKFEFGIAGGQLLLVDEVLTPDSSRLWPADEWKPGTNPPSFDKQFLRDYLASLDWGKQPPPPTIPAEIIAQTRERYVQACRLLTGRELRV